MDDQSIPAADQPKPIGKTWLNGRAIFVGLGLCGLLAVVGLIFPGIALLRNSEMRTRSLNNVKQIGLAIHSYHDANNGRFPMICDHGLGSTTGTGVVSLHFLIIPYVEGG